MLIVPPGSGIVHQVNLEYLARVVFEDKETGILYPDTVVGYLFYISSLQRLITVDLGGN